MAPSPSFAALTTLADRGRARPTAAATRPAAAQQPPAGPAVAPPAAPPAAPSNSPDARPASRPTRGFADLARESQPEGQRAEYVAHSEFERLTEEGSRAYVRQGRSTLQAIRVMTALVTAIAMRPGSSAAGPVKSSALAEMLKELHSGAQALALAATPTEAHKPWIQAQCMDAMAPLVATLWQSGGRASVREAVGEVVQVVGDIASDESLQGCVEALSESGYVEADDATTAAERVKLSLRSAAWDLHERVCAPEFSDGAGFFTYGRPAAEVVQLLLAGVLRIARESQPQIDVLDLRTSYLQGSIRRISQLTGAEYMVRTRQMIDHVFGGELSQNERLQRLEAVNQGLETRIVPEVLEWARQNFAGIEALAPKLLENQVENQQTQRPAA